MRAAAALAALVRPTDSVLALAPSLVAALLVPRLGGLAYWPPFFEPVVQVIDKTRPAPMNQADFAANKPTGPAPKTATRHLR